MSVEELVKELRRSDGWDRIPSNVLDQAADKLEELAAENEATRQDIERYIQINSDLLAENERLRQALTAAEQAEPAPAARSGAVKVKALEWLEHKFTRAKVCKNWSADTPFGAYRIERKKKYWVSSDGQGQWRKYFETLEFAKNAAQADYEKRILAALEPAEPAADAEPFCWLPTATAKWLEEYDGPACGTETIAYNQPIKSDGGVPLYTHPPESRYREALEEIANLKTVRDRPDDYNRGFADGRWQAVKIARAALAQGADDE